MGKKTGTFGSKVATGEIPSVAVGAETATAVFVEGVEEGEFSPEDSGEGEGEGNVDTAADGPGAPEGGNFEDVMVAPGDQPFAFDQTADEEPGVLVTTLPTEEELKVAFENTPGLKDLVLKVLTEKLVDEVRSEDTSNMPEWVEIPLERQIDRKFTFEAQSRRSGSNYDESNAVVFLARDPAFLYALDGYLTGCIALGADIYQIEAVKALKERVMEFQEENGTKLPDVEAGEERDRMMARF